MIEVANYQFFRFRFVDDLTIVLENITIALFYFSCSIHFNQDYYFFMIIYYLATTTSHTFVTTSALLLLLLTTHTTIRPPERGQNN